MIVKFIANSRYDELTPELAKVNLEYGYTYYKNNFISPKDYVSNKFLDKILSKIEKTFFKDSKNTDIDNLVINKVGSLINYVNSSFTEDTSIPVEVKIFTKTKLNESVDNLFTNIFSYAPNFFVKALSPYAHTFGNHHGIILDHGYKQQMFLGTSVFENGFLKQLNKTQDINDTISFVFLHEFGHSLQLHNNKIFNTNQNTDFLSFLYKVNKTQHTPDFLFDKKEQIKFDNIYPIFSNNIRTLSAEIYADVTSILLYRDYQIKNNTYLPNKTSSFIDDLIAARNTDFEENKTSYIDKANKDPIDEFYYTHHFTTPGLVVLKDKLKELEPSQQLSQEDIHNIANECMETGTARLLYSIDKIQPDIAGHMINSVYSANIYDDYIDKEKYESNNYLIMLEEKIGKEWKEGFEKNIAIINDLNLPPLKHKNEIFTLGTNTNKFKKENYFALEKPSISFNIKNIRKNAMQENTNSHTHTI